MMKKPDEKKKRQSGMVRVRGGFSDTNGISTCNTVLQVEEFDDATRVQLCNRLFEMIQSVESNVYDVFRHEYADSRILSEFAKHLLNDVFCTSIIIGEGRAFNWRKVFDVHVRGVILDATYNEVLDTVEYICRWFGNRAVKNYQIAIFAAINHLFEEEYVGYRFVDGRIVAITDKSEIDAIEKACAIPFDGCRKHIEKAIGFLSDREARDYKNCIKESISAVESVCQVITSNSKATLGDALKNLEKNGTKIHPCLSQAFSKLYGYASDQGGIRHAEGLTESNVTFEEAKFMLVSCSAFVNYLIAESGKSTASKGK